MTGILSTPSPSHHFNQSTSARRHQSTPSLQYPHSTTSLSTPPLSRAYILRSCQPHSTKRELGDCNIHLQVHWPVGHAHEVPQLHEQPGPMEWGMISPWMLRGVFFPRENKQRKGRRGSVTWMQLRRGGSKVRTHLVKGSEIETFLAQVEYWCVSFACWWVCSLLVVGL